MEFCRGCGREIARPAPGTTMAQVPCVCGFLTVFESNVTVLRLRDEIARTSDIATAHRLLQPTDDVERCTAVLKDTIELFLQGVKGAAAADPVAASAALWPTLVEFDRRSRLFRGGHREEGFSMTVAGRSVQILLGALFELGISPSFRNPLPALLHTRVQQFVDQFFHCSSTVAALAPMVDNLRAGLATARIVDGTCEVRKTPAHSRLQEWSLNRARLERERQGRPADDVIFSAAATEAVESWLGFSPAVGRTLFADGHRLLVEHAVKKDVTVYAIPRSAPEGDVQSLLQHLTLTTLRAERFEAPFYWDLGAPAAGDQNSLLTRLAIRNWLFYYPVIEGVMDGEPVYFASAEALTHGISGLEGFKNGMLQRVATVVSSDPSVDPAVRTRINQLRVAANRRFEVFAAEQCRQLGFDAIGGLDRVDGKSLDCGEIDLLATAVRDGRLLMILGEVKDFDITLHRIGAEASLGKRIESAEAQLDRKAATVRRHWRRLAAVVSGGPVTDGWSEPVLATVLVTSSYLPPHLSSRYPALTMDQFAGFVGELQTWPSDFGPRFAGAVERLPT